MDINFCKECSSILYPKEDRDQKIILLNCHNCDYVEESKQSILFYQKFHVKEEQIAAEGKDLVKDKTLARTMHAKCPKCGGREAVYMRNKREQEALLIQFVCCFCEYMWSSNKILQSDEDVF